jgi:hypothetical protein
MKNLASKVLKIVIALAFSGIFLYLAFREVDLKQIVSVIANVNVFYLVVTVAIVLLGQILRSLRWGVILKPMEPISQKKLFPISSIGFLFIVLLPARLGELARPYLISKNSQINLSAAAATVVLERLMDSVFIFSFFAMIVTTLNLPKWVIHGALYVIGVILLVIIALFIGNLSWVNRVFNAIIRKILPHKLAVFAEDFFKQFYQGMEVLKKGHQAALVVLLTLCIWASFILCNFVLFKAFHLSLGIYAALTSLILTALGISVPAGPGLIGNYHYFIMMALEIFGVSKEVALSYALVNHGLVIGSIIIIGIISFNVTKINFGLNFLNPLSKESPEQCESEQADLNDNTTDTKGA